MQYHGNCGLLGKSPYYAEDHINISKASSPTLRLPDLHSHTILSSYLNFLLLAANITRS